MSSSTQPSKPPELSPLPPAQLVRILEAEQAQRRARNRLASYQPYPKQSDFHAAGATYRERLFLAGNRCGKTEGGAFECAIHLTGLYPEWWTGKRFDKPIWCWVAGVTGESTRDIVQAKLFGPPDRRAEWGTGTIPHRCLDLDTISTARGIAGAIDMAPVRHFGPDGQFNGWSSLGFKSYEKGREKWQGTAKHLVWFDEEPPIDIYTEGLTRTNETGGIVQLSCTPLLGMSAVMERFLMPGDEDAARDRTVIQATIADAGHFTDEQRAQIIASYPAHEREARVSGVPQFGSGRVFQVEEEFIRCAPFEIPAHWPMLGGLDFGWDHPSAGALLAWDRDADVIYVVRIHRAREQTPAMFAAAVKPWGAWLKWAWPHDGLQHDKGSGEQLAKQYAAAGLNMMPERATFPDGSNGLEAGVTEMLERMQTGRWKVFGAEGGAGPCEAWWSEFRLYHREDGIIVKANDDAISASRYAMMMRRFATLKVRKTSAYSAGGEAPRGWMG